ncbi:MAG: MotA/TolQ/ExbB proton channel family protein [Kiritimatiellae bacterium]|nr:MotA/TolQ/ExbB proton channel family protein [Kiritimatiellia bacterium]
MNESGKPLAIWGMVLQFGSLIGLAGTVSGMVRIFAEFAKDSAAQQEALASDISRILYTTVGGIVLSVMGVILLLVALIGAKYRASWFQTIMWILAILWLFSFPFGTALGIFVMVYLSKHSTEFTKPSPAPDFSPATAPESAES